jgi:MFS family permease
MISLKCPHCGRTATFASSDAGQLADCPHCRKILQVPGWAQAGRPAVPARAGRRRTPNALAWILLMTVLAAGALVVAVVSPDGLAGLCAAIAAGVFGAVAIGMIPGLIAEWRHCRHADAIGRLALIGIFVGIVWLGALIWALVDPPEDPQ